MRTRLNVCSAVVAACAGAAFATPPEIVDKLDTPPEIVKVTNLLTGQVFYPQGNNNGGTRATGVVVYDNYEVPSGAAAGFLNVAYVEPGVYDGSNTSTSAYLRGMTEGTGTRYPAPDLDGTGPHRRTGIWWDDYDADFVGQGLSADTQKITNLSWVVIIRNELAVTVEKTLNIFFMDANGEYVRGAVAFTFSQAAGAGGYSGTEFDFTTLPFAVPFDATGFMMYDWDNTDSLGNATNGCGMMFMGGDRENALFPTPTSLFTLGVNDVDSHYSGDGFTGTAGPPVLVDPTWDSTNGAMSGDPLTVSYLDAFNTGYLILWNHTATTPYTRSLPRGWQMRIHATCLVDFNGDGFPTGDDFDAFVAQFELGELIADFNNDGFVTGDDFDAYVARFELGC